MNLGLSQKQASLPYKLCSCRNLYLDFVFNEMINAKHFITSEMYLDKPIGVKDIIKIKLNASKRFISNANDHYKTI